MTAAQLEKWYDMGIFGFQWENMEIDAPRLSERHFAGSGKGEAPSAACGNDAGGGRQRLDGDPPELRAPF